MSRGVIIDPMGMGDEALRGASRYRMATIAAVAVTAAAAVVGVAVSASMGHLTVPSGNFGDVGKLVPWDLNMVAAAAVGAVIARTQPANRVGWWFSAGGLAGAVAALGDAYAIDALHVHRGWPGASLGAAVSTVGLYGSWALLGAIVPLLFPDGEPHTRFRRRVAWVAGLSAVACAAGFASPDLLRDAPFKAAGAHNALGVPALKPVIGVLFVGIFGLMLSLVVAVVSLFARLVRARGTERQQLKVVAYAAAAVLVASVLLVNVQPALAGTWLAGLSRALQFGVTVLLPVAFGVAIARYRLYDVDRVVSRAVAYGALVAVITAAYVAVVVGGGSLLGAGDRPNVALSVVATALVAAGFQPVRHRLERLANRLVYGRRASPYEVVAGFARRMAGVLSLEEALPRLAEAAATGVGALSGRVEVFLDTGSQVATWPPSAGASGRGEPDPTIDHTVPIVHQGEEIGRLGVTLPQGAVLDPAEQRVLSDLASQAGVAVRNAQLTAELQVRLEEISAQALELRRSRQRIVAAGDAERKRVERDLHDGAQQRLVSLGMVLRMARSRAPSTVDSDLNGLLDEAAGELERAQRELRDLARGIYPAVLVDGGLAPAVESLAERSPMPIEVRVADRRYPPSLETTAYFVVNEALTNVAKHASAAKAIVEICESDDRLRIEVTDDGAGGARPEGGSGLRGLADRVAALDGRLDVLSPPGAGTRLVVELPCG